MRLLRNVFVILSAGILGVLQVHAQSGSPQGDTANWNVVFERKAITTIGQMSSVTGQFSISYTVGQPIIGADTVGSTAAFDYYVINQGYQQATDIKVVTGSGGDMTVYPNPVTISNGNRMYVKYTADSAVNKLEIRILTSTGQLMATGRWESGTPITRTQIIYLGPYDMSRYIPGIYFMSIIQSSGLKTTRRFVKM